jgi:hypothetical protein
MSDKPFVLVGYRRHDTVWGTNTSNYATEEEARASAAQLFSGASGFVEQWQIKTQDGQVIAQSENFSV